MIKKRMSEKDLSILANFYKDNDLVKRFNISNVEFFNMLNVQNMEFNKYVNKASYILDQKLVQKNEMILIIDEYIENSFNKNIKNNILLNILKFMKDKYLK